MLVLSVRQVRKVPLVIRALKVRRDLKALMGLWETRVRRVKREIQVRILMPAKNAPLGGCPELC